MSNYTSGRQLEYDARNYLRQQGYEVFRSAGSKSPVDLIAVKQGQVLLVQAKTKGVLPPAERHALARIAGLFAPTECLPLLVTRPRTTFYQITGTEPHDRTPWTGDLT